MSYGIEFIYFFKYYNIPIGGETIDNSIDVPHLVREFKHLTGSSVSVRDEDAPPESAKAKAPWKELVSQLITRSCTGICPENVCSLFATTNFSVFVFIHAPLRCRALFRLRRAIGSMFRWNAWCPEFGTFFLLN